MIVPGGEAYFYALRPLVRGFRKGGTVLKTIARRLRRLEDCFGPPVETEYMRELQRRIEAGLHRVAAAKNQPYVTFRPSAHVPGLTLAEAILRGSERARQRALATDIEEDFNLGGRGYRAPRRKHAFSPAAGKVKSLMS